MYNTDLKNGMFLVVKKHQTNGWSTSIGKLILKKTVNYLLFYKFFYLRNKTSVPVFYRRIKYRYEFGCV